MKNFFQSAAPIILAVLAFIFFHLVTRELKPDSDISQNERLKARFDSLVMVSRVKDSLLVAERLKFDSLYAVKSSLGKKVSDLTKNENEKTIAIDSVNSGELYGLFSGFNINP